MSKNDVEFIQQLILGSYVFSAGCYVFGFWIVRCLNRIQNTLSRQTGVEEGQDLVRRVQRLELALSRRDDA